VSDRGRIQHDGGHSDSEVLLVVGMRSFSLPMLYQSLLEIKVQGTRSAFKIAMSQ
jgi:hypothetical protein